MTNRILLGSLPQTSWATKKLNIHSNRLLFFTAIVFFILCRVRLTNMDNLLGRKSSIPTTNDNKPLYAMMIDFVSQVYIIRIKIHEINKNIVGAKSGTLWEFIYAP